MARVSKYNEMQDIASKIPRLSRKMTYNDLVPLYVKRRQALRQTQADCDQSESSFTSLNEVENTDDSIVMTTLNEDIVEEEQHNFDSLKREELKVITDYSDSESNVYSQPGQPEQSQQH